MSQVSVMSPVTKCNVTALRKSPEIEAVEGVGRPKSTHRGITTIKPMDYWP
jgi:hypothetical protein